MIRKRMLYISSFFPNPSAPNKATYNKQQLLALAESYDIDAVVPIPWVERLASQETARCGSVGRVRIHHPTYFYTPLILRNCYGLFYYRSILATVRRLTSANSYDFIFSSWLFPDGWAASKIADDLGVPLHVSVLGTDVNRLSATGFYTKRMNALASRAASIISVSKPLRDKLVQFGCPAEKVVVVDNGVDSSIFHQRKKEVVRSQLGIPGDTIAVLFVGNLKKEKGLVELVEAFNMLRASDRFQKIRLFIVGAGRYRDSLVAQITKLELRESVTLCGELPMTQVSLLMSGCDVLCLPSYMEGQPNVIIEARACGARVVATTVGGIPDLDDGSGALRLVPPRDAALLAGALAQSLEESCSPAAPANCYSWHDNAKILGEIFERKRSNVAMPHWDWKPQPGLGE